MTINKATEIIERLLFETSNKREIKVYKKFIQLLNGLKNKTFSEDEIQSIEKKLDQLNLESNPKNRKKYFKKTLNEFEEYLKATFSLIVKGHYATLYSGLGISFGILFGVVFLSSFEQSLGITFGMIIGMVIGSLIGRSMDTKAETEGKTL